MSASMATATQPPFGSDASALLGQVEALGSRVAAMRSEIGRLIFGQGEIVDHTLITLLSGGHALLVGVPGLGKSRLVETLGVVLGLAVRAAWRVRAAR